MTDPVETEPAPPEGTAKGDKSTARWVAAGAAMGIGSAALVAALLYAGRSKAAKGTKK